MLRELAKSYNEALFDTDREKALVIVREAVDKGVSPEDVLFKVIVPGIDFLGALFDTRSEYQDDVRSRV